MVLVVLGALIFGAAAVFFYLAFSGSGFEIGVGTLNGMRREAGPDRLRANVFEKLVQRRSELDRCLVKVS